MLRRSVALMGIGALFLSARLRAQQEVKDPELIPGPAKVPVELRTPPTGETPQLLRWMVHPRKKGMMINLPIIDTDPNRHTTIGAMPIWVIPEKYGDRIEQIHAPSITYNRLFKFIPTYRYYLYPDSKSSLILRTAFSSLGEQEVLGDYETGRLRDKDIDFSLRLQYNVDGSNHIYGLGPASPKSANSDYTENILHWNISAGVPIVPESLWRIHVTNHFAGEKIYGGKAPVPDSELPPITDTFPALVAHDRQEVNETHVAVDYDSRDNANTTSQGAYLQVFAGGSIRGLASQFDFTRYGLDGRYFYENPKHRDQTTALRLQYEQLLGRAPFWLLPRLGGKYSMRAYGEGRYIDRGTLTATIEQRCITHKEKMAGVSVEFEVAPFIGAGTVFDTPGFMVRRYMRPVFGIAGRAIARPQVVGSVDFGVGQEGLAAFLDINYSY